MTSRGKIIAIVLVVGLLVLLLALFRSCTVADTQVDDAPIGVETSSLRAEAPRLR